MPKRHRDDGWNAGLAMLGLWVAVFALLQAASPVPRASAALAPNDKTDKNATTVGADAQTIEATDLARLRNTVDALRDTGRRGALKQLESDRTYTALKAEKKVPQPLGDELAACLQAPTRACLLREALAHAYRIGDRERRDWMLEEIAKQCVRDALYQDASQIIALVDDPRYALRVADAIDSALAAQDKATPATTIPSHAVTLARRASEAALDGRFKEARALLAEDSADRTDLDGSHARAFADFEIGKAWIVLYETSIGALGPKDRASFQEKARTLASANPVPGYRARLYLHLAAATGDELDDPQQTAHASDLLQAEQAIGAVAPAQRRVFLLTGLQDGAAPPDILAGAHTRAAAIAAEIATPFGRAQSFLRLAATLPAERATPGSKGAPQ